MVMDLKNDLLYSGQVVWRRCLDRLPRQGNCGQPEDLRHSCKFLQVDISGPWCTKDRTASFKLAFRL